MITGRILSPDGKPILPKSIKDNDKEVLTIGATVLVLKGPKGIELPPKPNQPVEMKFKMGRILPAFQVVVVGQELIVTLEDEGPHNLHCSAPNYSDPSPTVGEKDVRSFSRVFKDPIQLVHLACTAHPTETAFITVAPNSLFATPDKNGVYRLTHSLIPGDYTLRAVSPDFGVIDKEVSITKNNQVLEVDMQFRK